MAPRAPPGHGCHQPLLTAGPQSQRSLTEQRAPRGWAGGSSGARWWEEGHTGGRQARRLGLTCWGRKSSPFMSKHWGQALSRAIAAWESQGTGWHEPTPPAPQKAPRARFPSPRTALGQGSLQDRGPRASVHSLGQQSQLLASLYCSRLRPPLERCDPRCGPPGQEEVRAAPAPPASPLPTAVAPWPYQRLLADDQQPARPAALGQPHFLVEGAVAPCHQRDLVAEALGGEVGRGAEHRGRPVPQLQERLREAAFP